MASLQEQDVLKEMILTFRVSELQMLLGFAGRNKHGKKHELLSRALDLVKIRSTPMQNKIRELYKVSQESQAQDASTMNPYYNNLAMMGMGGGYQGIQQATLQGRNPYTTGAGYPGVPSHHMNMYNNIGSYPQVASNRSLPIHPNVNLAKLPFYDIHADLVKPTSLMAQGGNRFQEAQFQFLLSPSQATNIASNRDIQPGSRMDYLYQVQLRFFPLPVDLSKEVPDEFPPSVVVHCNGKQVQLPNPIPTNKPGVEPKRPPKPVNITPLCKLSPILPNNINIKWAAEYGKSWVVGIWLVMKLTSDDLLDRMKKKGSRDTSYTKQLIVNKLNNDDDDVASTSLKVTVSCPLGKMRMRVPCRPQTCDHLQCFDAGTFLQMNERKPTWNCPVCNSKAFYTDLLIDGYFEEVMDSKDLPADENEVILEADGSWKPVPKDEKEDEKKAKEKADKKDEAEDCIELSDDDEPLPPTGGNSNSAAAAPPPPLPPPPQNPIMANPPIPPMPPGEIECIDLD